MVAVDLGCGWSPKLHRSLSRAVGIDLNFHLGKTMVAHPAIADVQHVPIRDGVAEFVQASAILEHVSHPELALAEMRRIMRPGAEGLILIPCDARQMPQTLRRFIKEFPFSISRTLINLWRSSRTWRKGGLSHMSQVEPKDILPYFTITAFKKLRRPHFWFARLGPFWILAKLGLAVRPIMVEEFAEWHINIKDSN